MKITVSLEGSIVKEWFESADPAYLHSFRVLMQIPKANKAAHQLIIAAQQSESQGMGVQEWLVDSIT